MAKFIVKHTNTYELEFVIEADGEFDAIEQAAHIIKTGDFRSDPKLVNSKLDIELEK